MNGTDTHASLPPPDREAAPGEAGLASSETTSVHPDTPPLPTWMLFGAICLTQILVLLYYNQAVLTDAVYSRVLGGLAEARLDEYLGRVRRVEMWSYFTTPLTLTLRVAFVALFMQLLLLLSGREVPFRRLFRIATLALIPMLLQMAIQVGWLGSLPPETITPDQFRVVPGSLAALFMSVSDWSSPLYGLLSLVGAFEAVWATLLVVGMGDIEEVNVPLAVGVVAATWGTITFFKWGVWLFSTATALG